MAATKTYDPCKGRPYNRYNLFYMLERERFLQQDCGYKPDADGNSCCTDGKTTGYEHLDLGELPPLPLQYRNLKLSPKWYIPGIRKIIKRTHKKSHGVASFQKIAEHVADSWKTIDNSTLEYCTALACILKQRYTELKNGSLDSALSKDTDNLRPMQKKRKGPPNSHPNEHKLQSAPQTHSAITHATAPHNNDVLVGLSNMFNLHPGNKRYRHFVDRKMSIYLDARSEFERRLISSSIVNEVRNLDPPGRFLTRDLQRSNIWCDVGDAVARDETMRALWENTSAVRKAVEEKDCPRTRHHTRRWPPGEAASAEAAEAGVRGKVVQNETKRTLQESTPATTKSVEEKDCRETLYHTKRWPPGEAANTEGWVSGEVLPHVAGRVVAAAKEEDTMGADRSSRDPRYAPQQPARPWAAMPSIRSASSLPARPRPHRQQQSPGTAHPPQQSSIPIQGYGTAPPRDLSHHPPLSPTRGYHGMQQYLPRQPYHGDGREEAMVGVAEDAMYHPTHKHPSQLNGYWKPWQQPQQHPSPPPLQQQQHARSKPTVRPSSNFLHRYSPAASQIPSPATNPGDPMHVSNGARSAASTVTPVVWRPRQSQCSTQTASLNSDRPMQDQNVSLTAGRSSATQCNSTEDIPFVLHSKHLSQSRKSAACEPLPDQSGLQLSPIRLTPGVQGQSQSSPRPGIMNQIQDIYSVASKAGGKGASLANTRDICCNINRDREKINHSSSNKGTLLPLSVKGHSNIARDTAVDDSANEEEIGDAIWKSSQFAKALAATRARENNSPELQT